VTNCASAGDISNAGVSVYTPAFATTTSSLPNSANARFVADSISAAEDTSARYMRTVVLGKLVVISWAREFARAAVVVEEWMIARPVAPASA
jgi:hypothetical protein